jgi:integrase
VTSATVNREVSILRCLLRMAHERGDVERVPKIRLAREPEGRLRFLTEVEAAKLLEACRAPKRVEQSPYLPAIVTVALNTGMRKGEILGLAWERVDFARGVLLLERTKSGKRREIPMNRAVYDVLAEIRARQAKEDGHDPVGVVFRRSAGPAWGNFRRAFERAVEAAKLEDLHFHDLRHTFASWLVMRGRPLKEVQELLGHRTLAITVRYSHLSQDRLRDAVASLEDFSTTSAQEPVRTDSALVSTCQN